MNHSDWKEIRWNEALEMFEILLKSIKDFDQRELLLNTVLIISERLARATWITPNN